MPQSKRETRGGRQTKESIGRMMSATGNKVSYRAGPGKRGLECMYWDPWNLFFLGTWFLSV